MAQVLLDGQPLQLRKLLFTKELSSEQQARQSYRCDVMMGVHGAGLTHVLWMYPGSAVVELLDPEHNGAAYYRNVAHLSGHAARAYIDV